MRMRIKKRRYAMLLPLMAIAYFALCICIAIAQQSPLE